MLGSEILDVLVGLIVVFLILSLMASAVREAIEGFWRSRAVFLERGIRELLNDRDGTGIAREFYRHPMIYSLFQGKYVEAKRRWRGAGLPTYIPSRNFALALLDTVIRPEVATPYAIARNSSSYTIEEMRAGVARLQGSPFLQRAFLTAIDGAHGQVERVEENLKEWFDSGMDRVSGWYKRRTQLHLFVIGLVLTAALNIDTLALANHLWRNKAAREALIRRADLILADSSYIRAMRDTAMPDSIRVRQIAAARARYNELAQLNLPMTWAGVELPTGDTQLLWWTRTIVGFLLTAAAITLGAPFWFDLLNKMMVIRSTVKPKEKSQEEGSEDRRATPQRTGGSQAPQTGTPPPATPPPAPQGPLATAPSSPLEPVTAPQAFEERKWAAGKEDGLL